MNRVPRRSSAEATAAGTPSPPPPPPPAGPYEANQAQMVSVPQVMCRPVAVPREPPPQFLPPAFSGETPPDGHSARPGLPLTWCCRAGGGSAAAHCCQPRRRSLSRPGRGGTCAGSCQWVGRGFGGGELLGPDRFALWHGPATPHAAAQAWVCMVASRHPPAARRQAACVAIFNQSVRLEAVALLDGVGCWPSSTLTRPACEGDDTQDPTSPSAHDLLSTAGKPARGTRGRGAGSPASLLDEPAGVGKQASSTSSEAYPGRRSTRGEAAAARESSAGCRV